MSSEVQKLYDCLRRTPFPVLAKQVGDFPLYDSLLAGCADRASRGEPVEAVEIPAPDDDTVRRVGELRHSEAPNEEVRAFLQYFALLEQLRAALHHIVNPGPGL